MSVLANPVVLRWVVIIAKRMDDRQKLRKQARDIGLRKVEQAVAAKPEIGRLEMRPSTMSKSEEPRLGPAIVCVELAG